MKRPVGRLRLMSLLLALVVVGVGTKFYRGRFETWFHNYAGGVIYEVFWIVLFGALLPRASAWRIALTVFVVTCGLEVLQLWHPPFLELIRSNFFGKALLGDGFDPLDFIYYVVGSVIGWRLCEATVPWRNPDRATGK